MTLQPAQGGQRFAPGRATTPRFQPKPWRKKRQDFSAFALTYILRLSSCRVMGDFVISPLPRLLTKELWVLALFTVGDVYASLCKKSVYAPFIAQRRSRALFWL